MQLAGLGRAVRRAPERTRARHAARSLLVAAAYLPWLPYLPRGARRRAHALRSARSSTPSRRHWRFLFYNPGEQLKWFALAIFAIAAGRGLAEATRAPERRPFRAVLTSPTALLIAWLVVPFAIAFVRSKMSLPMINDRNLLISLPAAFLLFARAITAIIRDVRLQAVTTGAIVAIMLHGLFVTGRYYTEPRKEQFREAAQVVALREHEFPNATVIAHAWSKGKFDYYLERLGADARVDLLAGTAATSIASAPTWPNDAPPTSGSCSDTSNPTPPSSRPSTATWTSSPTPPSTAPSPASTASPNNRRRNKMSK